MTLRICDDCGRIDDGPRHMFIDTGRVMDKAGDATVLAPESQQLLDGLGAAEAQQIQAQIADPPLVQRHPACCAAAGCPDNVCQEV